MRSRLIKKRIDRGFGAAFSLSFALQHARPSFFALRDVGRQRRYLRDQMIRHLRVHPNHARYITRRWAPEA